MELREQGLQVLFERVKAARTTLGIKTFRRSPTAPVEEKDFLCVFMVEGVDRIMTPASRSISGYPARRELEVTFEFINTASFDIRGFYSRFRRVVLSDAILLEGVYVRETRAIGPQGYRTPNVSGMQLVLSLTYMDNG